MTRVWCILACCWTVLATSPSFADDFSSEDVPPPPVSSDFGGIGLMQVPTARMGDDGDLRTFASVIVPYHRLGIAGMVFPWAEGIFRLTQIINKPYGPAAFSGNQTYRDRGIDLRIRLYKEDEYLPDMTLGIRDVVGTGLFGSEYLVASRRFYDWDFTLGLGWGQLASDNMFKNPFILFGNHFRTRGGADSAGVVRTDFFGGPSMSLFGGVEYHTPIDGVTLQLEYNSDDFRQDPFDQTQDIGRVTPIDFAVAYRPLSWMTVSAGIERGNRAIVKLDLLTNIAAPPPSEYRDPGAPTRVMQPVRAIPIKEGAPATAGAGDELAADLEFVAAVARDRGWRVLSLANDDPRRVVIARVAPSPSPDEAEDIGQIARAAGHIGVPVSQVEIVVTGNGADRHLFVDTRALEIAVAETGRTAGQVKIDEAVSPPPIPAPSHTIPALNRRIAQAIFADLDKIGFTGESFEIQGATAILRFSQSKYRYPARAIGEAARAVLAHVPSDVLQLTFGVVDNGAEVARVSLLRRDLERALEGMGSAEELLAHATFDGGSAAAPDAIRNPDAYPDISYSIRPRLKTALNGPDGLFLYDVYAGLTGEARLMPGVSVTAELGASLLSDFDKLTLPSNSVLPHVRSDIADYLRDGRYGLSRLQTDVIQRLGPDIYGRFSAGLLEEMYAGADSEILYRPYGQRWALGVDVNHVWQRGFHEQFGLRAYQVTTGQLEFYYHLPWYNMLASIKAGRYLAGDRGATLDISREFASGVKIGAFATFTNVSSAQFGEGSFDKGIYISVPLDLILPIPNRSSFGYTYRPVTRDGGQMIEIQKPLYDATDGDNLNRILGGWSQLRD